jgi:peroxiredoxin
MKMRRPWLGFFLANSSLMLAGALRLGEPAPDLVFQDCRGAEARLAAYLHKKNVVVLAHAPGGKPVPAVLDDTCRQLDTLDAAVVLLENNDEASRKLLDNSSPATVLIDSNGVVRRILPGQTLTGAGLARFVQLWLSGQSVFNARCARCHGEDGASNICWDVKPLAGIGKRLSEAQIRERLRAGEVNERDVVVRGEFYSRADIDAVIVYVAGL